MKKLFCILTCLCVLVALCVMTASAETITGECGDNATYTLDTETGELIISGSGKIENNPPFQSSPYIKTVIIKEGITSIGWFAFSECNNITYVELPSTITTIESYAFYSCYSLTHLYIPKGVTFIGGGVCAKTGRLCFDVDDENSQYCDIDGVLFNREQTKIVSYAKDALQNTYEIPDTVTTIGEKAFANCINLINIIIPDSVSVIETEAFRNCYRLQNVDIPENVTRLESQVFYACLSFTNMTIHKDITYVTSNALTGCGWLMIEVHEENPYYCAENGVLFNKQRTELITFSKGSIQSIYTIPDGITSISERAFYNDSNLISVTIPDSVISIDNEAFESCPALEKIIIPKSVTRIGNYVFRDSDKIIVHCYKGSYADTYAQENDIPIEYLDENIAPAGDLDGDGVVSIKDVLTSIKAVLNGTDLAGADMNGDGNLTLIDVLRVLKLITA